MIAKMIEHAARADIDEANAALILAAPDLFEALEELVEVTRSAFPPDAGKKIGAAYGRANKALNRAKGGVCCQS